MIQDLNVILLLNSLDFIAVDKGLKVNQDGSFLEQVTIAKAALQEWARKATVNNWSDIVVIAAEFVQTPLARQVIDLATTWDEKYSDFKAGASIRALGIITADAVLQNPAAFMEKAREIYKEAFGINLEDSRHTQPRESMRTEEEWEVEDYRSKALNESGTEKIKAGISPQIHTEEVLTVRRSVERWLSEDERRLNVVDGLTREDLIALARENDVNLREDLPEGEMRRLIAIGIISNWIRNDRTDELEHDYSPFFLICGRYNVGFAGRIPEGGLDIMFQNYNGKNKREKYRAINSIFDRYWETSEKKNVRS